MHCNSLRTVRLIKFSVDLFHRESLFAMRQVTCLDTSINHASAPVADESLILHEANISIMIHIGEHMPHEDIVFKEKGGLVCNVYRSCSSIRLF